MDFNISDAVRTNQILSNYANIGCAIMKTFRIGDQPADSSNIKNKKLQSTAPVIQNAEFDRSGLLDGMGGWEYYDRSIDPNTPFEGGSITKIVDDFWDVPQEYQDSARIVVSNDKLKRKYGEKAKDAYYGIRIKIAIRDAGFSEDIMRDAFRRFLDSEIAKIEDYLASDSTLSDKRPEIIAYAKEQYHEDFLNGEYLNYAYAFLDQLPGGTMSHASDKPKETAVEKRDDAKKQTTGLAYDMINYVMGGSLKSPFAEDSGIVVIEYKKDSKIADILHEKQDEICDKLCKKIISQMDTGVYVGKKFVCNDDAWVPVLYTGFGPNDDWNVSNTVKTVIERTLADNGIGYDTFEFDSRTFHPTESQVKNAKERYNSTNGTWRGKIDKPILCKAK